MTKSKLSRVTVLHRCPICDSDSWCMVGDRYVLCMRVQSPKTKQLNGGEVGWLHPVGSNPQPRPVRSEREPPVINVATIVDNWRRKRPANYDVLAGLLGVSEASLESLECVRTPYGNCVWGFPMKAGDGGYVGIRIRDHNGKKWAEPGSHAGLFISNEEPQEMVWLLEGPTDTAAALTIGLYAVGRPSCSGGVDHVKTLLKRIGARRVVIVADSDRDSFNESGELKVNPGARGAQTLAEHLPIPSAVMMLPAKDMRAFVNNGGTKAMLDAQLAQIVWRKP